MVLPTVEQLHEQVQLLLRKNTETDAEVKRLTEENERIKNNQQNRSIDNLKISTESIAPAESLVLSLSKGVDNLTLDIYEFMPKILRKTRLAAGSSLTLERFVDVILVLLDVDSSKTLEERMSTYDAAEERNAIEELNTDFRCDGDWKVTQHTQHLCDRFVRYIVKYLYTAEIQEVVRRNYMAYVNTTDLSSVMPSSIIKELERFRKCSKGQREELVLPRALFLLI
jgi:hypothetical protein